MAKIIEENIVIKISKLVKDDAGDNTSVVTGELVETLETVVAEMAGSAAVVEVVVA